ncbi:putative transmembrane protein [Sesbania bispinosa]|nr:putative transmembrane protein [Sesbania bispinosa]
MASQVRFTLLAALFTVLAVVVAAHEGHDHGHLSPEAQPPSSYASSLNYHAIIGGFVPFLITFLIAIRNSL